MKPHWIILCSVTIYSVIIRNKWLSFQELKCEEYVLNLVFCFDYFDDGQSVVWWVSGWWVGGSVVLIKPFKDRSNLVEKDQSVYVYNYNLTELIWALLILTHSWCTKLNSAWILMTSRYTIRTTKVFEYLL